MHHVEDDDRIPDDLHEDDIGQLVDHQLACARYPLAGADTLGERGKRFEIEHDVPLYRDRRARSRFPVILGKDFLEIVERLVGPEHSHAQPALRTRVSSRSFSSDIASPCSCSLVFPAATRSIVFDTLPNSHSS